MLIFDGKEVLHLINLSLKAKSYKTTYNQLWDPNYRLDGKEPKSGDWPKPEEIDQSKLKPSLHLVGDQGIYLMSNSSNQPKTENNGKSYKVAYAKGCDGNKDEPEDWWDIKTNLFGGDDFVEDLGEGVFNFLRENLTKNENIDVVLKVLSGGRLSFSFKNRK